MCGDECTQELAIVRDILSKPGKDWTANQHTISQEDASEAAHRSAILKLTDERTRVLRVTIDKKCLEWWIRSAAQALNKRFLAKNAKNAAIDFFGAQYNHVVDRYDPQRGSDINAPQLTWRKHVAAWLKFYCIRWQPNGPDRGRTSAPPIIEVSWQTLPEQEYETPRSQRPEDMVIENMTEEELRICIAALDPKKRKAIDLFYMQGCSHAEIARALNITEQYSTVLLSRAKQEIRKRMEDNYVLSSEGNQQ